MAQLTDIHQDRVLLGLVEIRRLDHPRVEAEPVAHVELEELSRRRRQRRDACCERGVILEQADDVVGRERDQVGDRRRVEGGEGVESEAPIRRDVVLVDASLALAAQPRTWSSRRQATKRRQTAERRHVADFAHGVMRSGGPGGPSSGTRKRYCAVPSSGDAAK